MSGINETQLVCDVVREYELYREERYGKLPTEKIGEFYKVSNLTPVKLNVALNGPIPDSIQVEYVEFRRNKVQLPDRSIPFWFNSIVWSDFMNTYHDKILMARTIVGQIEYVNLRHS